MSGEEEEGGRRSRTPKEEKEEKEDGDRDEGGRITPTPADPPGGRTGKEGYPDEKDDRLLSRGGRGGGGGEERYHLPPSLDECPLACRDGVEWDAEVVLEWLPLREVEGQKEEEEAEEAEAWRQAAIRRSRVLDGRPWPSIGVLPLRSIAVGRAAAQTGAGGTTPPPLPAQNAERMFISSCATQYGDGGNGSGTCGRARGKASDGEGGGKSAAEVLVCTCCSVMTSSEEEEEDTEEEEEEKELAGGDEGTRSTTPHGPCKEAAALGGSMMGPSGCMDTTGVLPSWDGGRWWGGGGGGGALATPSEAKAKPSEAPWHDGAAQAGGRLACPSPEAARRIDGEAVRRRRRFSRMCGEALRRTGPHAVAMAPPSACPSRRTEWARRPDAEGRVAMGAPSGHATPPWRLSASTTTLTSMGGRGVGCKSAEGGAEKNGGHAEDAAVEGRREGGGSGGGGDIWCGSENSGSRGGGGGV